MIWSCWTNKAKIGTDMITIGLPIKKQNRVTRDNIKPDKKRNETEWSGTTSNETNDLPSHQGFWPLEKHSLHCSGCSEIIRNLKKLGNAKTDQVGTHHTNKWWLIKMMKKKSKLVKKLKTIIMNLMKNHLAYEWILYVVCIHITIPKNADVPSRCKDIYKGSHV